MKYGNLIMKLICSISITVMNTYCRYVRLYSHYDDGALHSTPFRCSFYFIFLFGSFKPALPQSNIFLPSGGYAMSLYSLRSKINGAYTEMLWQNIIIDIAKF